MSEIAHSAAQPHGHAQPHLHTHHPRLQHHFDSLEQQAEASTLGMWVFLVTEIMFFGGLFMAYIVYRTWYPLAFGEGSHHLSIALGGFNTAVLICSSLTMALAVHAAQVGNRRAQIVFLVLTILLGATFLGVKVVEYSDKFRDHLIPGHGFIWHGQADPRHVEIFYTLYFTMTGLHALHMIVGIGIMLTILWMAWRGTFTPEYYAPVEVSGLYWHFVDIVWIFLFPLLYLLERHA
ncbi:MAG TPA: cytochrome c oxidase subunit 3 family protein [Vicinamibacterales bacterium]|nr:cytochrome c oxidase subunit 3 family protein [Vicinamibacterales bacterium]